MGQRTDLLRMSLKTTELSQDMLASCSELSADGVWKTRFDNLYKLQQTTAYAIKSALIEIATDVTEEATT